MTGKMETRMREIRCKTRQYQRRYETRLLSRLTLCSLFLLAGIGVLFRRVQTPGIPSVVNGYGGVLLQDGAGPYIIIGLLAFVIGVTLTILCIRLKYKSTNRTDRTERSEEEKE